MKKYILIFLLTITVANCQSQQIHFIKFICECQVNHPIGIAIISVEKLIKTSNDIRDKMYGKSIKTDVNTYNSIKHYIETSKLLIPQKESRQVNCIKIMSSDGNIFYVATRNYQLFLTNLKSMIINKHLDKKILNVMIGSNCNN
jgi:hypothetical protein